MIWALVAVWITVAVIAFALARAAALADRPPRCHDRGRRPTVT